MDKLLELTVSDKRQVRKSKSGQKQHGKTLSRTEQKIKAKSKSLSDASALCSSSQNETETNVTNRSNSFPSNDIPSINGDVNGVARSDFNSKCNIINGINATSHSAYKELISDEEFLKTIDKVRQRLSESKSISSETISAPLETNNDINIDDNHSEILTPIQSNFHVTPAISLDDLDKIDEENSFREKQYADLFENLYNYQDQIENDFEKALEGQSSEIYDNIDEEFGKNIFGGPEDYFVEAYNKPGDELSHTYISRDHLIVYEYNAAEKTVSADGQQHNSNFAQEKSKNISYIANELGSVATHNINKSKFDAYICIDDVDGDNMEGFPASATIADNILKTKSNATDFGHSLFDFDSDSEEQYFVEAYNVVGEELCVTLIKKRQLGNQRSSNSQENKQHVEGDQISTVHVQQNLTVQQDLARQSTQNYNGLDFISNLSEQCEDEVESPNFSELTQRISHDRVMEVYIDGHSNPRIERISFVAPKDENNNNNHRYNKSDMIVQELLQTELQYVRNLENVIKNYMEYFRSNMDKNKRTEIFGNIREISYGSRNFYKALSKAKKDYTEIAKTVLRFEHLFELYPKYMKNKPKSDVHTLGEYRQVLKDRQNELNDRLGLASYLLNPIQRLGRYILLLENLQKSIADICPILQDAIALLKKTMKRGNDYVAIDSISEVPRKMDLSAKGTFLGREKFNMIKPKRMETYIFLFEDIVVFTCADHKNAERFIYKDSILMGDLSLVTTDGEDLMFQLKNFPECKKGKVDLYTYVFEARDSKSRKYWTDMIQKMLWDQLLKCRNEIFLTEKSRKMSKTLRREKHIDKNGKEDLSRKRSDSSKQNKRKSVFYLEESTYGTL